MAQALYTLPGKELQRQNAHVPDEQSQDLGL